MRTDTPSHFRRTHRLGRARYGKSEPRLPQHLETVPGETPVVEGRSAVEPSGGTHLLFAFEAAGVRCALPLEQVVRALFLVQPEPLPGAPFYVLGMLHLRHEDLPLIDLSMRLGRLCDTPYGLDTPMVICRHGERAGALVVERVTGLVEARGRRRGEPWRGAENPLFRAAYDHQGHSLLELDLERALSLEPGDGARPVEAWLMGEARGGRG